MILCFAFCIISTLLSFKFREVANLENKKKITLKNNIKDMKERF